MTRPDEDRVADVAGCEAAMIHLANRHEAMAIDLAQHMDAGSAAKAASHFVIADALRARAWRKR